MVGWMHTWMDSQGKGRQSQEEKGGGGGGGLLRVYTVSSALASASFWTDKSSKK